MFATAAQCRLPATLKPLLGQSPAYFRRRTDSECHHKGCPLLLGSGKVVVSAAAAHRARAAGVEKAIPACRRSAAGVEQAIPAPPQSAAAVEKAIPNRRVGATAAGNGVPAPSRGSRTRQKVFREMSGACASRASATFLNCIGLPVVQ